MVESSERRRAVQLVGAPPEAVTPPPGNPAFPLLDGLRAVAALAVFAYHVDRVTPFPGFFGALAGHGNFGVVLFFVLSGFLLYRPAVAARAGLSRPVPARTFYAKRALRIVPAYYTALVVLAIWPGLDRFDEFWWRAFTFTQNYWDSSIFTNIHPAWSLCIEVSFYALLPLYVALARRFRPSAAAELAALAALAIASVAAHEASSSLSPNWGFTLPTTFYLFAAGMGVAMLDVRLARGVAGLPHTSLSWPLAALMFVAISATTDTDVVGAVHPVYAIIAVLVLVPACNRARVVTSAAGRALRWGGLISYAFYLYHQELVDEIGRHVTSPWACAAIALPAVVAVATLSYYVVERPALRLKRRLR